MASRERITTKYNKNPFDFTLCIVVIILLSLGILMVLSASAPSSLSIYGNSYTYVLKQLLFGLGGLVLMIIVSKIDYRIYKKYYWIAYYASWLILLLVLVPGLGVEVKGATRWIDLKITRLQPSELTKIGLIIFYAGYLTDHKSELRELWKGFLKPLLFLAPPIAILYVVQNHLSVSIIIGLIAVTMMIMAGCKIKHFAASGAMGCSGILGILGMLQLSGNENFRLNRIAIYFDPWSDALGKGYQMIQSLYAIGSGGLFGVGLGDSKQKFLYIPEPHNDFIFAILAEELGFIGCLAVIVLFAIFIWRGVLIAMKAPDMFGSLMAIGITALVGFQAILNIAVVTASIPTTGMSLPFFSYGGSALLILIVNVGILLNISRTHAH